MDAQPRIYEARPGLWLVEVELDRFAVRGAALAGTERTVVWDSLAHPDQMAALARHLRRPPWAVVYSHADWDHVWGTAGLAPAPALIVGHDACAARFTADVPRTLQQKREAAPGRWDAVRLVPPTVTFATTLALDLGGLTLQLHALPGHTADCIVGYIPEWGVWLGGDTVETPLPVVNDGAALPAWIAALDEWARAPQVATVIPAHGAFGGREILARNVAYLRSLSEAQPPEPPGDLAPFYAETHTANRRHARSGRPAGVG